MNKQQKTEEVKALAATFAAAQTIVFTQNTGLKVDEMLELRRKLKGEESAFKVVKNRLAKLALKEAGLEGLDDFFTGPVAIATSTADPVSPAKITVEFSKDHEALQIQGGYMDGAVLDLNKVKSLAAMPSRDELYAKLLACLINPATSMAQVVQAVPRSLVTVLNAIKDTKN